jgi:PAS domain S-box-containing protein
MISRPPREMESMLARGGVAGALIRERDWAGTAVGVMETWPQSLRTALSVCLLSKFPMFVFWGPDMVQFYNDMFTPVLGSKHPAGLGQPARDCWRETWDLVGPMLNGVMAGGEASYFDDLPVTLERSGYTEECYFTFCYTPVHDEAGKVGGIFGTVSETTTRVVGERRLQILRELSDMARAVDSAAEVCAHAAEVFAKHPVDVPYALLYLLDADGANARLAAATGLPAGDPLREPVIQLTGDGPWPLAKAAVDMVDVEREVPYLARAGFDPPSRALVMPFKQSAGARPGGFLVAGLNSGRPLDEDYRAFASLAAGHIAAAIADATAFAAERRRARVLAELDRAKSAFFANVSHELRTPLTLMLGPLDDALSASGGLGQEQVTLVRRNGRRLLKLVDTLLDLSRLEAGRLAAAFRPVDLSALTSDLAAAFSEATDRAGLELRIACEPLGEPVYVDPDLWEQIVLNLVSNAFKFTLEGRITVELRAVDGHAELAVSDTGSGIPAHEVDRVFERFHRITTHQARSHEGAGIGLALVRELVELHGGTASVQSTAGRGSRFVLRVPFGRAHLPAGQILDGDGLPLMMSGSLFVDEALAWLPEAGSGQRGPLAGEISDQVIGALPVSAGRLDTSGAHVMIVDDNSDMRAYLTRLLSPHWQVETVDSGTTALERVRDHPPDLLVADVMMPELSGLELVGALRADPATRELPVIVLSARAGEEAAIEGLAAGADDYLAKPFSSRDLIARVRANLELSRLRRAAAAELRAEHDRLKQTLQQLPVGVILTAAPSGRVVTANEQIEEILGHQLTEAASTDENGAYRGLTLHGEPLPAERSPLARAIRGEAVNGERMLYERRDGRRITVRVNAAPICDEHGHAFAGVVVIEDVTRQLRLERLMAAQRDILLLVAQGAPLPEVLATIVRIAEELSQHSARASVLLRSDDGRRLQHGAAPSLPAAYNHAIDGITIAEAAGSCGTAAHRGQTVIVTDIQADPLWADFRDLAQEHGLRACWSTPIVAADGALVGTFAVYHGEPHTPGPEERSFIELFSQTAAVAIQRSRDARARAEQFSELQTSLLPRALAPVPGVEVAAAFHPATRYLQVGGDFYDVFPLGDGAWGFVIGDVCGHGAAAAAVTALTRHTTRVVALLEPEPGQVLATVNAALLASDYDRFCTAVYGRLTPHAAGASITLASGGHPAPLLRRNSGEIMVLGAHGPFLGVIPDPHFPQVTTELEPGNVLLLHTDGLTERNPHLRDEAELQALLASVEGRDADEILEQIERQSLGPGPRRLADDVAILLLRAVESAGLITVVDGEKEAMETAIGGDEDESDR